VVRGRKGRKKRIGGTPWLELGGGGDISTFLRPTCWGSPVSSVATSSRLRAQKKTRKNGMANFGAMNFKIEHCWLWSTACVALWAVFLRASRSR